MMLAVMKQLSPDVVWHGGYAGVPGAGVPRIGMREGGGDRVAVLCYSPKNELSCYRD